MTSIKRTAIILVMIAIMQCMSFTFAAPPANLKYQVVSDFVPFGYQRGNNLYGFDLDLAQMIFMGSNYKVWYSADASDRVMERIRKGEIDSCGLTPIKNDLKDNIAFSKPVVIIHTALYTKRDTPKIDMTNMKEFRVGFRKDDNSTDQIIRDFGITNYTTFDSYPIALQQLVDGNIDVLCGKQEVINYRLVELGLKSAIVAQSTGLYPTHYAIGVKKSDPQLLSYINKRLDALIDAGVFEDLYQVYFFSHSESYYKKMIMKALFLLAVFILGALGLGHAVHSYVRRLRKKLEKANESTAMQYHWLQSTLSSIGDAVITLDNDGKIIFMNKSAEVLKDYVSDERIYQFAFDSLHRTEEELAAEVDGGSYKLKIDYANNTMLLLKSGEENWFYYYTSPVMDNDSVVMGYVLVIHDITVRRQAKILKEKVDENIRLLNITMESDKIKTEFFSNISHELRTPINVILATQQLLELFQTEGKAEILQQNIKKYVGITKQNCYRLLKLVNNLVDITKINAGYYELSLANHNIVSLVEDITESIAQYMENKSINTLFDTNVEEKIIACDADKIERIMLNLLSNAVKFTPVGGNITICVTDMEYKVQISVKDTGIGIPENMLEAIFDRFTQVESKGSSGSGIGLALTKSLVEMHGGCIYVKSIEGEGSEFIVELPASLMEDAEDTVAGEGCSKHNIEKINVEFSDT